MKVKENKYIVVMKDMILEVVEVHGYELYSSELAGALVWGPRN